MSSGAAATAVNDRDDPPPLTTDAVDDNNPAAASTAEKTAEAVQSLPPPSFIPDVAWAKAVLDEDHFGLEKVKKRIVEFVAVGKLKQNLKGPILCLVGVSRRSRRRRSCNRGNTLFRLGCPL